MNTCEDELRQLRSDYNQAMRDCDDLRGKLESVTRERDAVRAEIRAAYVRLGELRALLVDAVQGVSLSSELNARINAALAPRPGGEEPKP